MEDIGGKKKMDSTALDFGNLNDFFEDMFSGGSATEQVKQEEITKEEEDALVKQNVENISNVNLDTAVNKLLSIQNEMNNEFVERNELIEIMIMALVTNSNLLMLGPPGTAKSKISMALCNRIENSNFFQWLLNKSSDPAELLGTFSIKGMENDQFKRVTDGKLPEANIAFIDEVYKCNSPTLNALLSIMNEHIFYNDGKVVHVPLISMFAASNEPPEDESLLAMHDRFLFRMEVEYVHDNANKKRMFNNYLYERAGVNISNNYTTITIDELKLLQEETKKVVVSKDIINKFISIINSLNKNSTISISDRRANECFKVLQGSAIVHNRKKVTLDDFNSLKYVLWDKKEDMDAINAEIAKIANPFDENFEKYKRQFEQIKDQFDRASNDQERNRLFYQHNNSLKSVINKFNKLINDASSNGKDIEEYAKIRDEIVQFNTELVDNAVGII
jgi:MoxR-like ATPase